VLLTPSLDRPTSTLPWLLPTLALTHLGATPMDLPLNVANKGLTVWLNPLDATFTKNRGWAPFLVSNVPVLQERARPSRDENPVTATPLFPTLTNCDGCKPFRIRSYENCRVWSQNFHFGTPRTQTKGLHRALSAKGTLHFSVGLSLAGILFFHESRDTGHSHRCGSTQTPPAGSILWVVS
jgi:hypothetical protein